MAKIGIMSMQRIVNYGSFLQAYALKKILEEKGHEVQFVDYHVEETIVKEKNQTSGVRRKISKAFEVLKYDAPLKHRIQFIIYKKSFAKKYHKILGLSKVYNYNPVLDLLVIGSDEVFNCVQTNVNVGYSLELFGKDNRAKKLISYAASFGNTTLEKLEKLSVEEEIADYLKKFDAISVRDANSAKIVENFSIKNVSLHMDPVILYDYMGNSQLIPKINIREKYLVLYAYSGRISLEESEWIKNYAVECGLKIYAIGGCQRCADRFIDCSPFEVFSYFANAEVVVTDTFHGTIFSVVTKKKFVTLIRKSIGDSYGNEEKISDLLERLRLLDRAVYNIEKAKKVLDISIDYSETDSIIKYERKRMEDYLKIEV